MRGRAALKAVAWTIGVLTVLAVAAFAIGWFLPEEHRAERRAVIAATPEQVYELISDVERYPSWRSNVTRVEVESRDPELRFREYDGDDQILFVIDSTVPNEKWVSVIADDELPFGGRWVFTLSPKVGGTELKIVEEGEVYDPFFRFVSKFVTGHSSNVERYLEDVKGFFTAE